MTNRLLEPLLDDTGQPAFGPETTKPLLEGAHQDGWKPNNSYRNRSRCCPLLFTSKKLYSFKDVAMQLFLLPDPYLEEKVSEEYFDRNSMDKFVDLLEQLALKSPKRDEFEVWIQYRKKMKSDTTNEEVWEVLFDAKERGFITAESVDDLNHFRVVT